MWAGELGHAFIALSEMGEDAAAGRIREGGERAIQRTGGIFNHLVK